MADFCRQCSVQLFGEDFGDLAGITKAEQEAEGLYALALCEGCGPIQVDHAGDCVSKDCLCKHGVGRRE